MPPSSWMRFSMRPPSSGTLKPMWMRTRAQWPFRYHGSQNFLLMETLAESLAGRAAVIPFLGCLQGVEGGNGR